MTTRKTLLQNNGRKAMSRKILSLFAILFIISVIAVPVYADQTVFGPKDLKIGKWHVHLSSHRFTVDDPLRGHT